MYVTAQDYRDYAALTGATLPVADADCTLQLEKASQFIDSKEPYLKGTRAARDQDYAFPRIGLKINGYTYDSTEIPAVVEKCQMALALEINAGVDLFDIAPVLPIIKERVEGAVEVQYGTPSKVDAKERQSIAMSMLRQLMVGPSISIPLVRV
jgi:hypothetical protein